MKVSDKTLAMLARCQKESSNWLLQHACPLWFKTGFDHEYGGSYDKIEYGKGVIKDKKRTRVHTRQIFSYVVAQELGWKPTDSSLLDRLVRDLLQHYRRPDGLYYYSLNEDMSSLDDRAFLYEQAFVLTALAKVYEHTQSAECKNEALNLIQQVKESLQMKHGGFIETYDFGPSPAILANSHMHLFEAMIAWAILDDHPIWEKSAATLATLCSSYFFSNSDGGIFEFFDKNLIQIKHNNMGYFEPGHQYEWAWLLNKYSKLLGTDKFISLIKTILNTAYLSGHSLDRKLVINTIYPNGQPFDSDARLWPQTESIKALLLMATTYPRNKEKFIIEALAAWQSLTTYFHKNEKGLWADCHHSDGGFVLEPSPASSLYHISGAISSLHHFQIEEV